MALTFIYFINFKFNHTTMSKLKPIIVPYGTLAQIAERLQVSRPTIKKALSGIVNTPQHAEIRKLALRLGGVYEDELTSNEKEA